MHADARAASPRGCPALRTATRRCCRSALPPAAQRAARTPPAPAAAARHSPRAAPPPRRCLLRVFYLGAFTNFSSLAHGRRSNGGCPRQLRHVRIRAATMAAWVKNGSEMRRARAGRRGGVGLVRCLTAVGAPQVSIPADQAAAGAWRHGRPAAGRGEKELPPAAGKSFYSRNGCLHSVRADLQSIPLLGLVYHSLASFSTRTRSLYGVICNPACIVLLVICIYVSSTSHAAAACGCGVR